MKARCVLLVAALLAAACAPLRSYRTVNRVAASDKPELEIPLHAFQEYHDDDHPRRDYSLGFVEFDDQGQLFSREQLGFVMGQLWTRASAGEVLVVVFVHGWRHNAAPGDGNVKTFRDILMQLSEAESYIAEKPRKVIGVYFGWRGLSATTPLMKTLSFWDRKNTAHQIGTAGATEVLSRIERVCNASVEAMHHQETKLVVIGHSFGGALLYSALSQILVSRFVNSGQGAGMDGVVKGFGDLVVLINPAFEAMQFSSLSDMANERSYFPGQLPLLAILTSEADLATKRAFPVGRNFSTLFERERNVVRRNKATGKDETISERKANVRTVGHFTPYRTHFLRPAEAAVSDAAAGAKMEPAASPIEKATSHFRIASQGWEDDKPGGTIPFPGTLLRRNERSVRWNPYLVVRVDEELISGHNDIANPRVIEFIRELILVCGQSHNLGIRYAMREHARGKR